MQWSYVCLSTRDGRYAYEEVIPTLTAGPDGSVEAVGGSFWVWSSIVILLELPALSSVAILQASEVYSQSEEVVWSEEAFHTWSVVHCPSRQPHQQRGINAD